MTGPSAGGRMPAPTGSASSGSDGGDVAQQNDAQRDPDLIQKEIEQTRAELADTIDAIADRISPKRAASRGAAAVKAQGSLAFGGGGDHGAAPRNVLEAAPELAGERDPQARPPRAC